MPQIITIDHSIVTLNMRLNLIKDKESKVNLILFISFELFQNLPISLLIELNIPVFRYRNSCQLPERAAPKRLKNDSYPRITDTSFFSFCFDKTQQYFNYPGLEST